MKTSSAKAKGRRACLEFVEILFRYCPDLKPDDIRVTSSGAAGEDIQLSPAAREIYPFVIEVKNQERLNIWDAIKQAESHVKSREGVTPILVFKRNHSKPYVALDADAFIKLVR